MAVIAAVTVSSPSLAYNIHAAGKHHERMTWLSEKCLSESDGLPQKCPFPSSSNEFEKISGSDFRQGKYWQHARWPDDPTRQLDDFWTIAKFGLNAKFFCPDHVARQGFFAGLTCGSHHGQFQFLHAMASSESETPAQTREYIRGWSKFAFRVATGKIKPGDNYCEAVAENAGAAAPQLAPEDLSYCKDRTVDGAKYEAWNVRTLFAFHCDKMFSSKSCDVVALEDDPDLHKLAATGALLHLIQDSYSQSHTARVEVRNAGPYVARVDCKPVQAFYFYGNNKSVHSAADRAPKFSPECFGQSETVDPITAGARLLYYVNQGETSEEKAVDLIVRGVLGVA